MITGEQIIAELGNFDGAAEILQAWRDGMAPEPALLVSDWADKHRMLSSRGSAEPGPWRTARTPYLRAIMDALSPAHPAPLIRAMRSRIVHFKYAVLKQAARFPSVSLARCLLSPPCDPPVQAARSGRRNR